MQNLAHVTDQQAHGQGAAHGTLRKLRHLSGRKHAVSESIAPYRVALLRLYYKSYGSKTTLVSFLFLTMHFYLILGVCRKRSGKTFQEKFPYQLGDGQPVVRLDLVEKRESVVLHHLVL